MAIHMQPYGQSRYSRQSYRNITARDLPGVQKRSISVRAVRCRTAQWLPSNGPSGALPANSKTRTIREASLVFL